MDMLAIQNPEHASHRSISLRLALAVSTAAMIAACGGGGGGGNSGSQGSITGNGFAPSTGPGDVDGYFPSAVGNQWTSAYTVTHPFSQTTSNIVTTTVVAPQTILGVQATVLSQVDPVTDMSGLGTYDSYFTASGGGLTFLGTSQSMDTITAAIVPYVQLRFPVQLGNVSSLTAMSMPAGQDAGGHPLTLDMVQQIDNMDFTTVDVPAGSFQQVLEQVITVAGKLRSEPYGLSTSFIGTETHWVAPGVGIVKQTSSLTVAGETTTSSQQLMGYQIDGVRHGVGSPMEVLGGLSPGGNVPPSLVGDPVVASDGARFLVVARKVADVAGTSTSWVAELVDADGATLAPAIELGAATASNGSPIGTRAAAVFDGIEYVVVHEAGVDSGSGSPSSSLVAVRVSTQGTLVGEPTTVAASTAAAPVAIMPTLSFDGTRCLLGLVRRSSSGASRITGVFLSPSTGAADGPEFDISPVLVEPTAPALAFDGVDHVIVWDQPNWSPQAPQGVFAARIDAAGDVLDPDSVAVQLETICCSDLDHRPAIASDGSGCMIVWQDHRRAASTGNNVYANRLSQSGQLLDGSATSGGIALTTSVDRAELSPTIAFFDGEYLAAWLVSPSFGIYAGLFGVRVSPQGSVLTRLHEGVQLTMNELQPHPWLAAGKESAMLTWFHEGTAASDSVGAVSIHPFAH